MRLVRLISFYEFFFFLMIRRPPRSTQGVSSAASDVYKRQALNGVVHFFGTLIILISACHHLPVCMDSQFIFKGNQPVQNFRHPPSFPGGIDMHDLQALEGGCQLTEAVNNLTAHNLFVLIKQICHLVPLFPRWFSKSLERWFRNSKRVVKQGSMALISSARRVYPLPKVNSHWVKSFSREAFLRRASMK
eukprot:TRINITY_DN35293_c0_g1_i2.p1 TRINITY_DN35293_c0_g1~~TRINITY_DN35293_c0_g1_i2.p1  ORF type:complete len:190 (+),score=16.17 TRINITY_DN35293_c0_g1_i2:92-661(+)